MGQSKVPVDPNLTPEMRKFLDGMSRDLGAITTTQIGAAGTTQTDFGSWIIKAPLNQDYRIIEKLPFGITITGFTAKTASGTVTATLKINSTAITTGAINVTSTQASVTPTALNVAAADDVIVLTSSAIASTVDLSFTIKYTRILAN